MASLSASGGSPIKGGMWAAVFVCFSVSAGVAAAAETQPEDLLPASSVLYFQWDGFDAHRDAFDKTELGKLCNEELRPLLNFLTQQALTALGPGLQSEKLLEGASPEELQELQSAVKALPGLLAHLRTHGIVVGAEAISTMPPRWQVTVVLPNAGRNKTADALFGGLRLLAKRSRRPVNAETIRGRKVIGFDEAGVGVSAWREGQHVVAIIGSEKADRTLKRLDDPAQPKLTQSAIFKSTRGFQRYTTYARGYVDVEQILSLLSKDFPPATMMINQLGVSGLKRFTFHLGYEGPHQRSTLEVLMPRQQRKGALSIFERLRPVSVDGMPPIAPDASYITTFGIDPEQTYQFELDIASQIQGLFGGPTKGDVREQVQKLEKELGVKFREDLLASLESPIVVWTSPSEGPFSMGACMAVKVKDEPKLRKGLDILLKSLGSVTGVDTYVKKQQYHGAEINTVHVGSNSFPLTPTYVIHQGWLVVALYPQPVQGYVYRARSGIARWQPSPLVAQTIAAEMKFRPGREVKIVSISESDPRPTLNSLLGMAPIISIVVSSYNRIGGGGKSEFDSSIIPNAQAITERIRPGVSLLVDDGESIRLETYATLPLGFQLTGMESYYLAFLPYFFLRAF